MQTNGQIRLRGSERQVKAPVSDDDEEKTRKRKYRRKMKKEEKENEEGKVISDGIEFQLGEVDY